MLDCEDACSEVCEAMNGFEERDGCPDFIPDALWNVLGPIEEVVDALAGIPGLAIAGSVADRGDDQPDPTTDPIQRIGLMILRPAPLYAQEACGLVDR